MRQTVLFSPILFALLATSNVTAQSTISDSPLEITSTKGLWAAFLPAYELGTNANGGAAFRDNLDDVSYIGDLKLVRRFLGTRTSFEVDGFYGYAGSINKTGVIDVNVPNPTSGVGNALSGGSTHLRSDLNHYGLDVALRDTWRTRFGGLSAGAAFSYIGFDQKFDVDYGAAQLFRERLDTDFRGGKGFVGWDGCFHGRPTFIDLAVGFYDMDADYQFEQQQLTGTLNSELSKTATSVETTFTTRSHYWGHQVGLSLSAMYLSDLPQIQHNVGSAATLTTDEAVILRAQLELLLH